MLNNRLKQLQEIKETLLENIRASLKTSLKKQLIDALEAEINIEASLSQNNLDEFKQQFLSKIEKFRQVEIDFSLITIESLNNSLAKKFDIITYKLANFSFFIWKKEVANKKEYKTLYTRTKDLVLRLFEVTQDKKKDKGSHQISIKEEILDLLASLLERQAIADFNIFYNEYTLIFNLIINLYESKDLKNTFHQAYQLGEEKQIKIFPEKTILDTKRVFIEIILKLDKKIIYQYLLTQIRILNKNHLNCSIITTKFNNSFINFCMNDENILPNELKFALLLAYQITEKIYDETQDGLRKKLDSLINKVMIQNPSPHLDFLNKYREILGHNIQDEIKELQLMPINLCIPTKNKNSDLQENKQLLNYFFIETIYRSSSERLLDIFYASLEDNKEILKKNGVPPQKTPKKLSEQFHLFSKEIQQKWSSSRCQLSQQLKKTSGKFSEQTHSLSDEIQQKFSNVKNQFNSKLFLSPIDSLDKKNVEKKEGDSKLRERSTKNSIENKREIELESTLKSLLEEKKELLALLQELFKFKKEITLFFQTNNPITTMNNTRLEKHPKNNLLTNLSMPSPNEKINCLKSAIHKNLSEYSQKAIQENLIENLIENLDNMIEKRFLFKKTSAINFIKKIFIYGYLSKKRIIEKLSVQLKGKLILEDEKNFFLHKNFWDLLINYSIIRWPWFNKDIFLANWIEQMLFLKATEIIDFIKSPEKPLDISKSELFKTIVFLHEKLSFYNNLPANHSEENKERYKIKNLPKKLEEYIDINTSKLNKLLEEVNAKIDAQEKDLRSIKKGNSSDYLFYSKIKPSM